MKVCFKCGNNSKQFRSNFFHKHHIIYDPEDIVTLCMQCHYVVTRTNETFIKIINTYTAKNRKLTTKERYDIWDLFLNDIPCCINRPMLKYFIRDTELFKSIVAQGESKAPLGGILEKKLPKKTKAEKRLDKENLWGFYND